ncbi:peroxiredoxin-2C-like [Dendrobium catenatum]|uniref:peroxiredoxin-2C-like n=1 Tax=Dendrobium catenatum TaxID=906689 RepID=UPI0009F3045A|nr:peroxiredoxin-2C-like [Dendrobium catenatum]
MAPITVGDTVPDGTLHWFDENDELQKLSIHSLAAGKKILIIGVPGAFNPIFSVQHLPGFIPSAEKLKFKGVDELVLIGGIFLLLNLIVLLY